MKRILTIQDLSCVGKCSLTAALPIISAAGIEACPLPTALLSTHTAFPKFTFTDLTEELPDIVQVFEDLHLDFDAYYTGYLGSVAQIDFVTTLLERRPNPDSLVIIDPVMGDWGKLYSGFTQDYVAPMERLCSHADLLLPNLTEATFLLHEPYPDRYDEAYIRNLLVRLCALGSKAVALTGVSLHPSQIGYYFYDSVHDRYHHYEAAQLPSVFHGTGDVFAACTVGAYLCGKTLPEALTLATDFTLDSISATVKDPNPRTYGVNFEEALPMLIRRLSE